MIIKLIIESNGGGYFGRILYNDNLLVDDQSSIEELEIKFKKILKDFEGLNPNEIQFERLYDITTLIGDMNLPVNQIAEIIGISPDVFIFDQMGACMCKEHVLQIIEDYVRIKKLKTDYSLITS